MMRGMIGIYQVSSEVRRVAVALAAAALLLVVMPSSAALPVAHIYIQFAAYGPEQLDVLAGAEGAVDEREHAHPHRYLRRRLLRLRRRGQRQPTSRSSSTPRGPTATTARSTPGIVGEIDVAQSHPRRPADSRGPRGDAGRVRRPHVDARAAGARPAARGARFIPDGRPGEGCAERHLEGEDRRAHDRRLPRSLGVVGERIPQASRERAQGARPADSLRARSVGDPGGRPTRRTSSRSTSVSASAGGRSRGRDRTTSPRPIVRVRQPTVARCASCSSTGTAGRRSRRAASCRCPQR